MSNGTATVPADDHTGSADSRTPDEAGSDSTISLDGESTLTNALLGAVVTVVAAPVLPAAAVIGGGVAGYLEAGDLSDGATVGALAGGIAALPVSVVLWLFATFLVGAVVGTVPSLIVGTAIFAVTVLYHLAAGALGGALGAYVQAEL